jgi:cytochrome b561
MADLPSHADTGAQPEHGSATGQSRWKAVAAIAAAIALIVLFAVLHLTGVFGPGGH